jgi:hypothetical protein
MAHEHTQYVDHHVVNQELETIGTVTDVLYDDDAAEPKWLVVKPGAFQAERYVPTAGSYTTDDGNIVVPFDKRWVKSAPKAGDHVMTSDVEHEAARHYDVEN